MKYLSFLSDLPLDSVLLTPEVGKKNLFEIVGEILCQLTFLQLAFLCQLAEHPPQAYGVYFFLSNVTWSDWDCRCLALLLERPTSVTSLG